MTADHLALLVRYQVLAATRRHFEVLFFAVVAFSWSFALAVAVALRFVGPELAVAPSLSAATILLCGSFVAHRLLKRERSALQAMNDCWCRLSSGQARAAGVTSRAIGAMEIVLVGQTVIVVAIFVLATISQ